MNPNHICIIGAQRSGTTYLYHLLNEHPEIFMAGPVRPEPKFFLDEDEFYKGRQYYFKRFFSSLTPGCKYVGEKGTSYIEFPVVGERLKSWFPDGKVFIILRHPVYRAISNYLFSLENGLEIRTPEEVFIERKKAPELKFKTSVSPFSYFERGCYANYLIPFLEIFGDNLKVIVFEELIGNIDTLKNIYSFLGVETNFIPASIHTRINGSSEENTNKNMSDVISSLKQEYKEEISKTENLLNRKIEMWHD